MSGTADPECTDCGGTGITYQTERLCACQPTPEPDSRPADVAGLLDDMEAVAEANADMFSKWLFEKHGIVGSRAKWKARAEQAEQALAAEKAERNLTVSVEQQKVAYRDKMIAGLEAERAAARARIALLEEGLRRMTEHYVRLSKSGDLAYRWPAEKEPIVIESRSLLGEQADRKAKP